MIVDLNMGGVLIPGLLMFALIALVATMVMIRIFAAIGIRRLFAHQPLLELTTFVIIYSLLLRYCH